MLTERLRQGIRQVCTELEVPVQVTGLGSLFAIHFVDRPVTTWRDVASADKELTQQVFLGLMNEGILLAPSLLGCLSVPMGEAEVDAFVEAFRKALDRNLATAK